MTVNELEQAIRNLIASQPMITSGPSGEAINSVLSVVYSFREFAFRLQNHPFQDALKVNMLGDVQKVENDLVISICQMMQERGINLMLYVPVNQYGAGVPQANYQMPPQNMVMGQMLYNPQMNNNFGAGQVPPQPMYAPPQQNFNPPPQQMPVQPRPRKSAPNFEKAGAQIVPQQRPEPPKKASPVAEEEPVQPKPAPKAQASGKKQVVDSLVGEFQGEDAPAGKAAGRDYLLELLKK